MEKLIEGTAGFQKITFGEDTFMMPYDDDVKKTNWNTLKDECKLAAVKKVFTKIYADKILQEIRDNEFSDVEILDIYHQYRLKESNKLGNVLFVTINPRPDINFDDFKIICDKYVGKKWIQSCIYVFEQRGKTIEELGKGFHCHMLLWRQPDKRPNQVISESKKHFAKICETENPSILNIKNCKEEDIQKRKKYMLEDKSVRDDPTKEVKQDMDVKWRQLLNIGSYYEKKMAPVAEEIS